METTDQTGQTQQGGKQELRYNEELVDFVDKEFERRKTDRKPFELQWRLNMEFLNGNQYLDINTETMTIMDVPRMFWYSEREVFNQIGTIAETRISRLSRQKPIMKVRPATSEQNDLGAAKVSSMLLTSTWHDENMDKKYDQFIAWLETCGTAFFKNTWNKNKGRVLQEDDGMKSPEEEALLKKDKTESPNMKEIAPDIFQSNQKRIILREGDIETMVVSPFEIYPDASHGDIEDCKSIIHARAYHIHDIEDLWGVKIDEEKVDVSTLQQSNSGSGGLGYSTGAFRYGTKTLRNYALVKEYYELPSTRYPYGRFIVVAGKKCLYAGVLPYRIGDDGDTAFPFVGSRSIRVVGSFWGKSVIERCIPIQRRYNALRNRKAEYLNLVTIGQWYAPEGILEDETVLSNEPGSIIRYRNIGNGLKPEPVVYPSLPSSFETEESTLLQEFTAVSGVSELSRFSEAPSGVKSGVALSIANEQDDTRIAMTAAQLETASIEMAKQWLRLYRQFAQEPRVIRYVGNSSEIDVLYWTSSDLRSDDVVVDNASALAETPSQRRQMVFDLMKSGLFNRAETNPFTPEGVRRVLEMIDFGHWETGADDEEELQVGKSKRENKALMSGQMATINEYDDDAIHIREHYHFMMNADYEEILQSPEGPFIDQLFKLHVQGHRDRQNQLMFQQQMMAMGIQPQGDPMKGESPVNPNIPPKGETPPPNDSGGGAG